jgi:tripeptide aminopeptidase
MKHYFTLLLLLCVAAVTAAQTKPPRESAFDRFMRYVKIDTQSAEDQETVPSTQKQFALARLLEKELKDLDAQNVRVSEHCIVYATIPGNLPDNSAVPVIGLIAHLDTSPAVSGANVNPVIHKNYQGGDIILPNDKSQVITVAQNPDLKNLLGDDIITADGTTLLGSDDKAGIAEIMTMIDLLRENPALKHGALAIAFTPDEEVGGGIEKFDIAAFGAKFAYTVDGEELGEISNETWNAQTGVVTFQGKNTHPGTAKGIMVNSVYAAGYFLGLFPPGMKPETTEKRVGFLHPYDAQMKEEESVIKILLRDFTKAGLASKGALLKQMVAQTERRFPKTKIKLEIRPGYDNMLEILQNYPQVTEAAFEATRRAGLKPHLRAIRGGTDGSRLTVRGLPTPNLFTGGHNFHGKLEFNSRRGLDKSTEMLVHLVQVWAEKGR